jgi:hypothetical protein
MLGFKPSASAPPPPPSLPPRELFKSLHFFIFLFLWTLVGDPDPYVLRPPGSASGSVKYGSVSGSGSGSFHHQAKIVRKTLISSVLRNLYAFLPLFRIRIRIHRMVPYVLRHPGSASCSGSQKVPKCHGSPTLLGGPSVRPAQIRIRSLNGIRLQFTASAALRGGNRYGGVGMYFIW